MNYCLETKQLTKEYGQDKVVSNLALQVPQRCVYGFLGPNGAGKTTTFKMLLGLAHPNAGEITLFGEPVNEANRLNVLKKVGSLIENPSYYGHLTARENLEILCLLKNVPVREIDRVLGIVKLSQVATGKKVKHFSLGMKQRLGIAAALLGMPRLLLLDEPTNGLDPGGIYEIRELIRSLPERYGMTVILSSHLLAEIDQVADQVGIIRSGELVFQDTLAALHAKSAKHLLLDTSDNERAGALLGTATAAGGELVLPYLDKHKRSDLSFLLAKNRIGVTKMQLFSDSLEEIFLQLTKAEVSL